MTDHMGDLKGDVDRAQDGNFKPKFSDGDIIAVLEKAAPEPLSATEVGERAGMARTTAHNRLERLADEEMVQTKKLGARARAYWLADDHEPDG
jgi:predicted transcriptional regulator